MTEEQAPRHQRGADGNSDGLSGGERGGQNSRLANPSNPIEGSYRDRLSLRDPQPSRLVFVTKTFSGNTIREQEAKVRRMGALARPRSSRRSSGHWNWLTLPKCKQLRSLPRGTEWIAIDWNILQHKQRASSRRRVPEIHEQLQRLPV